MKDTTTIMGMHVTVEIVHAHATMADIQAVYDFLIRVDERFSTYKSTSEISKINRGELAPLAYSQEMRHILSLCEDTKRETSGYFDSDRDGVIDPSGIVKGWAIWQAAKILSKRGFEHFYVDCGGDVQVSGHNRRGETWSVGIRNPFNELEIVKVLRLENRGIATSGTSLRGQHIYNPHDKKSPLIDVVSLSVIGPNVYDADRFATAAFAMGREGIRFIERLAQFEGYMIDSEGIATYTSGFGAYVSSVQRDACGQLAYSQKGVV